VQLSRLTIPIGIDLLEDVIRKRYDTTGFTVRIFSVMRTMVSTAEPENIQAVLATKFHDFELGPTRRGNLGDLIGSGIFTADGEKWSHFRHQLKPQFTRDQVSDLEAAERHLQVLFKALPAENTEGWVEHVDLAPLLYRFTLDTSTEFLFGQSVNSQTDALHAQDSGNTTDSQKEMKFAEAMSSAQATIMYRLRLGSLYWLMSPAKFKQACQTVKDFTGDCVAKVLDPAYKPAVSVDDSEKRKFVLLEQLAQQTKDPVEIRDQSLHLLLAGRDTTASLLSWVILLLSRYPNEFNTLRTSILSHFGSSTRPKGELTFQSLKECKELAYILYETLRLYPIVPMNSRVAKRDTVLPTGGGPTGKMPVAVRKGESVGYSTYVMHRRHDIWGEDADEFRPARWEGRKLGWEFVPFSGGARVCIGRK
jgi:cytochrome P450